MSYTVTQRTLGAVPGWHGGTGAWQDFKWLVDPSSVPTPGNLSFVQKTVGWNTLLFEIADNVVPNWFGVAIPEGITDFANPHIFFHPTPGQAGYNDGDYPTKSGQWPQLFHYADELGSQVAGAARNQVVIFPFLTEAAKDTGIFPANWLDIVTQILTQVRDTTAPGSSGQVAISQVAASSFSAGMIYLHAFVTTATGLAPLLAEAWDFDGHFSTYRWLSDPMPTWAKVRCIQYDQVVANDLARFHVPLPRWADYVNKPTSNMQVHSLIPAFMFTHAATITGVGGTIGEPGTHTGSASHSATATATGSGSASHSASATATGSGSASHSASATATGSASHSATASASHSASASGSASHSATASATHSASPPPPPPPPVPAPPVPAPRPVPTPVPVVPPPQPARVPIGAAPPVAPVPPQPPTAPPPPPVPTPSPHQPGPPVAAVRCPPAPCSDPCATAATAVVASASTVAQVAATAIAAMSAARQAATHKAPHKAPHKS